MIEPYTMISASSMLLNTLFLTANSIDGRSDRIRLWWWQRVYGSSIINIGISPQMRPELLYKHWLSFIKLSIEYKKYYPNGMSNENSLILSDDLMYLMLYAPSHIRDHFWTFTDPKNPDSFVPKKTTIYLPADEFEIQSLSKKVDRKGISESMTVNLNIKCYIQHGFPVAIRSMTSQWFFGGLTLSEAREAEKETLDDLQDFQGLDSLISDIVHRSPTNTRFHNYISQKIKNTVASGGNPNPKA